MVTITLTQGAVAGGVGREGRRCIAEVASGHFWETSLESWGEQVAINLTRVVKFDERYQALCDQLERAARRSDDARG